MLAIIFEETPCPTKYGVMVELKKLTQHPDHKSFYGEVDADELLCECIRNNGVYNPPLINRKNQVISGFRRVKALLILGCKKTDVTIIDPPAKYEKQMIIESNIQRKKSIMLLAKEIQYLKKLYDNRKGRPNMNQKEVLGKSRDIIARKAEMNPKYIDFLAKADLKDPDIIDSFKSIDDGKATLATVIKLVDHKKKSKASHVIPERRKLEKLPANSEFHIYCQSSTNLKNIKSASVDLVVTSPPYGDLREYSKNRNDLGNLDINGKELYEMFEKVFAELYRVLKPTSNFYLNVGDFYRNGVLFENPEKIKSIAQKVGFILVNTIIWHKPNFKMVAVTGINPPSFEFIFHLVKDVKLHTHHNIQVPTVDGEVKIVQKPMDYGKKCKNFHSHFLSLGSRQLSNFWQDGSVVKVACAGENLIKKYGITDEIRHCATFPIDIPMLAILQSSNEGDIVLDPFSGQGTTGVAALKLFRKYRGIDINPQFADASRKLLSKVLQERNEKFESATLKKAA